MDSEWLYIEIVRLAITLLAVYVAYRFGLKSQKIQVLREYIATIVKSEYPALFHELKRNYEHTNNYLNKPDVSFHFPTLNKIYEQGLDKFVEKHHKDLFQALDSFKKEILPKFSELDVLRGQTKDKICSSWANHLRKMLPGKAESAGIAIARDLIMTISPRYVLPDLLFKRYEQVRNKIEERILAYSKPPSKATLKKISQTLIQEAEPEVNKILTLWKELHELNKREVDGKLFPLLQKYISNPI